MTANRIAKLKLTWVGLALLLAWAALHGCAPQEFHGGKISKTTTETKSEGGSEQLRDHAVEIIYDRYGMPLVRIGRLELWHNFPTTQRIVNDQDTEQASMKGLPKGTEIKTSGGSIDTLGILSTDIKREPFANARYAGGVFLLFALIGGAATYFTKSIIAAALTGFMFVLAVLTYLMPGLVVMFAVVALIGLIWIAADWYKMRVINKKDAAIKQIVAGNDAALSAVPSEIAKLAKDKMAGKHMNEAESEIAKVKGQSAGVK